MSIIIYIYNIMATLNYIGSKKSLLHFIDHVIELINPQFKKKDNVKFLDGFSGSGIVGKYFNKKYGFNVYSNDMEYYSYVLSYALLKVPYTKKLKNIIEELNKLSKSNDKANFNLITENYSEDGKEKRKFWTIENAQKADAIIENIKTQLIKETISQDEYFFLLASLLSSFDKYSNTASVYGVYLKKYKKSALKTLEVKPIHNDENIVNCKKNVNLNVDINDETISDNKYHIVYLDPPYNNRQYSTNYHPLNFIAKYDASIIPYGKTGLLKNSNKSNYSISKNVENSFNSLIENIDSKFILLSYNNEGIMESETIKKILEKKGKTTLYKYKYKKFKSQAKQDDGTVYEYLYLCEVNVKGGYETFIVE
jgi:adenine-specific DNA-methyltransferase